mmetsp:Transcript_29917/g.56028  ORF Transcript_29917/g.56028 Transcript_29917/m.56028 type:complete len:257 (-) Transcript_29917:227-997(-)
MEKVVRGLIGAVWARPKFVVSLAHVARPLEHRLGRRNTLFGSWRTHACTDRDISTELGARDAFPSNLTQLLVDYQLPLTRAPCKVHSLRVFPTRPATDATYCIAHLANVLSNHRLALPQPPSLGLRPSDACEHVSWRMTIPVSSRAIPFSGTNRCSKRCRQQLGWPRARVGHMPICTSFVLRVAFKVPLWIRVPPVSSNPPFVEIVGSKQQRVCSVLQSLSFKLDIDLKVHLAAGSQEASARGAGMIAGTPRLRDV